MSMKIDHIAIWVNDLEGMRRFYTRFFNMECGAKYENTRRGFSSYFLSYPEGARIEIMHQNNVHENTLPKGMSNGIAHLAISVGSVDKVDDLTEVLRREGFVIQGEPRLTGDGYYESIILDPEGNYIEITE